MIVSLLTDYGHEDEFVGVLHGVIRTIAPDVPIVDLTHGIMRHDVREGAIVLRNALPYLPVGVHVAVVDPQVGTERRAVAVRTGDGRVLVGPDNGLLSLAWARLGGAVEAVDVSRSPFRLEPVSATFHGRDVFAPVGARLAAGAELLEAGDPLDTAELAAPPLPQPRVEHGAATGHAILVDRYGNVSLNMGHAELLQLGVTIGSSAGVEVRGHLTEARVVQTFADVAEGELLLYEDAWGSLALAVNRGDASAELGLDVDDEVRITPGS
ncbi:MAG: S-adenosyl-l-methionine hydroxide adenosyltransferase family protein [Thermoleophilaceae bacterium]